MLKQLLNFSDLRTLVLDKIGGLHPHAYDNLTQERFDYVINDGADAYSINTVSVAGKMKRARITIGKTHCIIDVNGEKSSFEMLIA